MAKRPSPLSHLLPDAVEAAALTDEERFTYIDTDRWIPYARADAIVATLEDLLKRPRINRPPNMLLVGRSGNGKSHILDHFALKHPGITNLNGPNIIAPVMLIETPPSADADDLYDTILHMLNKPRPSKSMPNGQREAAKDILRDVQTKILMLDEINHILSGSVNRRRDFLFSLKHLSNELQMSIVIAGTVESLQLLHVSDQIENRFSPETLPLWTEPEETQVLLANFEQVLPLRNPSRLGTKKVAKMIKSFGINTIGGISALLNNCSKEAIRTGKEAIDEKILTDCAVGADPILTTCAD